MSLSAPAAIAEGVAKRRPREFRRFVDYSLGSLGAVTYLLRVARDLDHLTDDAWRELETQRD